MSQRWFFRLTVAAALLALCVAVLGAFVRLSDAGLGCPDWPGCYGRLVVPQSEQAVARANEAFPERPVEIAKGWKEMVHRYLAGVLGLLILALAVGAWRNRRDPRQQVGLPLLLLGLVIFQSILGMWTVTWQLKPAVVMAHLLGGAATVSLLALLALRERRVLQRHAQPARTGLRVAAAAALVVVVGQIALGGWTSANYAALACTDFPTCHGEWWPQADFQEAFVLWRGLGVNYEFGVLDAPARVAIQLVHRVGAVVTLLAVLGVAVAVWRHASAPVQRGIALGMGAILLAQFLLGIGNVLLSLPLPLAVAHNAGALLLLLALVALNYSLSVQERSRA
jgi:heme a synthase